MFVNAVILSLFKSSAQCRKYIVREIASLIFNSWNFQFAYLIPLPDLKPESHEVNKESNNHAFWFSFEKMEVFKRANPV